MPTFSFISRERLSTCHEKLQQLFNEVIKHFDCAIIDGYRNEERQNKYYEDGKSQLKYPQSKHNQKPSLAVDVCPYPVDWHDIKRFYYFIGFVKGIASQLGIEIVSGADWDDDTEINDQRFNDLPHYELKEE